MFGLEDCLYLSVYVPTNAVKSGNVPVMFWIYGGAYILGDSFEFGWYDGQTLANARNVIVVAPNYRVGALGFLGHSALQKEDADGSTGNYGVQDQQLALKWVQENIGAFGGDASRVTIFGESAGAFSVCWHLANARSKGLFSAAIIESGSCDPVQFMQPLPDAVAFGALYAASLGCKDADPRACLRALSASDITQALPTALDPSWPASETVIHQYGAAANMPEDVLKASLPPFAPLFAWGPVVDGSEAGTPAIPLHRIRKGQWNKVPVIIGSNDDEGSIFIPFAALVVKGVSLPLTDAGLELAIAHFVGDKNAPAALLRYPAADFSSPTSRGAAMIR